MKKIILSVAFVATAAIAGVNYLHSQKNVEISDLTIENVEALAGCEVSSQTLLNKGVCVKKVNSSEDVCVESSSMSGSACSGTI